MTRWLLRLVEKKNGNIVQPKARAAVGRLCGAVGIGANLLLFGGKLTAGLLAGSVSVAADAMNNLSDASSSIVTLLGFKLAEKPADDDHPYGHARYEYLSGLAVAAVILLIGFELAKTSVDKILHPAAVGFSWLTAAILLGSIAVKLWLWRFNRSLGKTIDSTTLLATAADSRNDCISTGAVLLSAAVQVLTSWQIDGVVGLAVALFILYSGVMLGKQTISPILGEAADPQLRKKIVDYIRQQPKVLGYHDLMVHDYGPGQRFATLHVEMDEKEDPLLCHELIDNMERECLQTHNVHLVIHYDPVVTDDPVTNRFHHMARQELAKIHPRLHTHDFRVVQGKGHTNLVFDVSLPGELKGQEKNIREQLEDALSQQAGSRIYTVITFDPAAFNDEVM